MIEPRRAEERGHFDHGWLKTYHTFSFADYFDPKFMGFSDLRVINEDFVHPGKGFPFHSHRDMEIITYVIEGALEHKDSLGNGSIIRPGEVQRMSAGTGVRHSELNPLKDQPLHLLQIWILPAREGIQPSYEQKKFSDDEKRNRLRLVASPNSAEGSVTIHQDARLYASLLSAGKTLEHSLAPGRSAWVQLIRGEIQLNEVSLGAGDGAAVNHEGILRITSAADSELLLFDLS